MDVLAATAVGETTTNPSTPALAPRPTDTSQPLSALPLHAKDPNKHTTDSPLAINKATTPSTAGSATTHKENTTATKPAAEKKPLSEGQQNKNRIRRDAHKADKFVVDLKDTKIIKMWTTEKD